MNLNQTKTGPNNNYNWTKSGLKVGLNLTKTAKTETKLD